jgi:sulfur carrier protein
MHVIVNGRETDVTARDIAGLLSEMDYAFTQLAIAVNRKMVPKKRWAETVLSSGDEIEIITPRQGG